MKLSVFLLVALLALCSAAQQDQNLTTEEDFHLNPALGNIIRKLKVKRSPLAAPARMRNRIRRSSSMTSVPGTSLEWLSVDKGWLPFDAVNIENSYTNRRELVCRYGCLAGFFSSSLGYHCNYADAGKEHKGFPFEFLINRGNFEILEWKADSQGRVPANSVQTCPGQFIYVGKNKYGLGKVDALKKNFYLPWEGTEHEYSSYEVLTMNKDVQRQLMYNVVYNTGAAKITERPPESFRQSSINNRACSSVDKTVQLSHIFQEEKKWDTSVAIKVGVSTTISGGIPEVGSAGVTLGTETTLTLTQGTILRNSVTHSVSIKTRVPPNHSCRVNMLGRRFVAEVPFTAILSRTYNSGETRWKSISGTFTLSNVRGIHADVERCEPLWDTVPCPNGQPEKL